HRYPERLREVHVEARRLRLLLVAFGRVSGQRDQDRGSGDRILPELAGDVISVEPRQADIAEHDVGLERVDAPYAVDAGMRDVNVVTFDLERLAERSRRVDVVLDDEDTPDLADAGGSVGRR